MEEQPTPHPTHDDHEDPQSGMRRIQYDDGVTSPPIKNGLTPFGVIVLVFGILSILFLAIRR